MTAEQISTGAGQGADAATAATEPVRRPGSLPSKKKLRHRILTKHKKGCVALATTKRRVWGTPWAYLAKVEYRDSAGRLRKDMSGSRWWRIGCNHIGCIAEIAVCERDILEHLPHE